MKKLILGLLLAGLLVFTKAGEAMAAEPLSALATPLKSNSTKGAITCLSTIPFIFTCDKENNENTSPLSTAEKILKAAKDERVVKLEAYFAKHNSPLKPHAYDFVYYADTYGLDWKLVPAISGVESTFGKRIPMNSYNAYGWANGKYAFTSWENSIEVVSRTLKEKYVNRGLDTVPKIARVYAPPSTTWSGNVQFFMNQIDAYQVPQATK